MGKGRYKNSGRERKTMNQRERGGRVGERDSERERERER